MKSIQYFVTVSYMNPMVGTMTYSVGDRFNSIEEAVSYIENVRHASKSIEHKYACAVNGEVWFTLDDECWIEKAIYDDGKLIYRGA